MYIYRKFTSQKCQTEHLVDKHKPGLNCSAVILVIQIPTPSINANKMAPTAADLTAADGPPIDEKYV